MALPDHLMLIPDDWTTLNMNATQTYWQMSSHSPNDYTLSGVYLPYGSGGSSVVKDVSANSYSSGWCGFVISGTHNAGIEDPMTIFELRGATQVLLRMRVTTNGEDWLWEYYNGSTFTQIGSTNTTASLSSGARRFDIFWDIADSGGSFDIYLEGALWNSVSGDTKFTADTTVDEVAVLSMGTETKVTCFVDSVDTRKLVVEEVSSSAAGFHSEYTGAESDIDNHLGSGTITQFVTFDASGERGTFNWFGFDASITDSWTVEGVKLGVMSKALVDPGFYLQGMARISSVDYDGDDAKIVPAGSFTYYLQLLSFDVDPSTSSAWANKSAVEAAQLGYKALTTPTV